MRKKKTTFRLDSRGGLDGGIVVFKDDGNISYLSSGTMLSDRSLRKNLNFIDEIEREHLRILELVVENRYMHVVRSCGKLYLKNSNNKLVSIDSCGFKVDEQIFSFVDNNLTYSILEYLELIKKSNLKIKD